MMINPMVDIEAFELKSCGSIDSEKEPELNIGDRITADSFNEPQIETRLNQSSLKSLGIKPITHQVRTLRLTNPLMQGTDVLEIQKALVKDGFAIATDGFYGEETEMAVRQFQARTGLPIYGVFDAATRDRLFQLKF